MAKPNYSFEKRQRELAKKRKKEDKAAKKSSGSGADELNPNEAAMAISGGAQGAADGKDDQDNKAPPTPGGA